MMISLLNKYKKIIFAFTVAFFVVAVFFGLGSYVFSFGDNSTVVDVGGRKISYESFHNQVNRVLKSMRDSDAEVNEIIERTVKQEVLREMIIEEILLGEAKKVHLSVSDYEVAAEIQMTPQFNTQSGFDARSYVQTIWNNFRMTPMEYEKWRKKSRMGNKFKQLVFSSSKVTPSEVRDFFMENKGNIKDFDKKKSEYEQKLKQKEFMDSANYMLRQITSKTEIKSYLDQIEKRMGDS